MNSQPVDNAAELEALREQLAEYQNRLAEFATEGSQKPSRDLIQLLNNSQFTFIDSRLFSLLQDKLPNTNEAPSLPQGGVPPPPPPPPPPSGNGPAEPSTLKPRLDFREVVKKCKNFHEEGFQIGEIIVKDKSTFEKTIKTFEEELSERTRNNAEKLDTMEAFRGRISDVCNSFLNHLQESPDLTAKELSELRQRYDMHIELFMKDAKQLKSLGLMTEENYGTLKNIRGEMNKKKEVLAQNLSNYLDEKKKIEGRTRELKTFQNPRSPSLPSSVPHSNYTNGILQLLKLAGKPEGQKIEDLLKSNLNEKVQATLASNRERMGELDDAIKNLQKEKESFIATLTKEGKEGY